MLLNKALNGRHHQRVIVDPRAGHPVDVVGDEVDRGRAALTRHVVDAVGHVVKEALQEMLAEAPGAADAKTLVHRFHRVGKEVVHAVEGVYVLLRPGVGLVVHLEIPGADLIKPKGVLQVDREGVHQIAPFVPIRGAAVGHRVPLVQKALLAVGKKLVGDVVVFHDRLDPPAHVFTEDRIDLFEVVLRIAVLVLAVDIAAHGNSVECVGRERVVIADVADRAMRCASVKQCLSAFLARQEKEMVKARGTPEFRVFPRCLVIMYGVLHKFPSKNVRVFCRLLYIIASPARARQALFCRFLTNSRVLSLLRAEGGVRWGRPSGKFSSATRFFLR